MAKRGDRWTYWRRVVREQAASGLTQVAFCAQRGVSRKSLQRWRSKLREDLRLEPVPQRVEVVVEAPPALSVAPADQAIELLIGEECVLYVAPWTPTDYVAELVVALRRTGAC
jgi:transposase-like protein